MAAADQHVRIRSALHSGDREEGRDAGHGHDGEAGRVRRAGEHHARRAARRPRLFRIVGHKWFFSAPMCDAFLILAQAPGGLTCFLLPRFTPDGDVNAIRIQRLKDKLGDRSNASSEVEFWDAYAQLVGDEGRGIATILEMGTYCRLDCALGTAGLIRGAVDAGAAPRATPDGVRKAAASSSR